ncbi:MAG: PaaI family thioesterase [Candidatus Dormiibacterota bacterium]
MDEQIRSRLNEAAQRGWVRALGLTITEAAPDRVVGEVEITERHHQAYGIAHGGVHSSIVETLASMGGAIWAEQRGLTVVGLENTTSFLRALRAGPVRAVATPLTQGRTTQVWEVAIRDGQSRLVATGRLRLLCLDPKRSLDGRPVGDHSL